jgi:hypothetical protein
MPTDLHHFPAIRTYMTLNMARFATYLVGYKRHRPHFLFCV